MKRAEAETAIRSLCHRWASLRGIPVSPASHPSFADFLAWLRENHPACLSFRSTAGAEYDAEMWFDQEMKQAWRR